MVRKTFVGSCAILLLGSLSLAAAAAGKDELHVKYEKYQLPNGMTVILHEDHSLPMACVNLLYQVGSKDEVQGRSGFAHLFEHLMFMGTRRVPTGEMDRIAESGGGKTNAMTSEDWTDYVSDGPASLLPTLIWFEADRLEDLAKEMTLEKLNLQRDVVRNERRQTSEMMPYGRAELLIPELMYPEDHPYHHPVIGSHADLQAATVDDVKEFFNTYYRPCNASLVVAGDFKPEQIRPLIEKLLGTLPRGSDPVHRTAAPVKLDRVKRLTCSDNVQFARTTIIYHSPAQFAAGDADMDLIGSILSSGTSSRLYKRLIYEDKIATDVSAAQDSKALGSLFRVTVTARPGVSLDKIEATVDEVLNDFIADGPTAEELKRQQSAIETGAVSSLESMQARAQRLNMYNYAFGEPDSFARDLERYRSATPQRIRDWAKKVLTPDARLILRVVPEIEDTNAAARETRPASLAEGVFKPQMPRTFTLSNGIKVMHWQRADLPLVNVSLMLRGGSGLDGAEHAGRAFLAGEMLSEGAGERGALAFSDAMQLLGASFATHVDEENTTIGLGVLKQSLGEAMNLYADAILRPRFDAKEWDRVRTLHLQSLKQDEDEPTVVARRVGMLAFFGPAHPYGNPVEGLIPSVQKLTLDDVKAAYSRIAAPANAVFFVAGDLSADEAKAMLEKSFGTWKAPAGWEPVAPPAVPAPANQSMRVVIVDKPDAVQTVIAFYMPAPSYRTPQRVPLQMISRVLGGSFTSRLNQNLREKHGYTYGAHSRFVLRPSTGYFTASSNVQGKVTGPALKEFLAELKRIRTGDISKLETMTAQQMQRMQFVESFQGLGGIVSTAEMLESNGLAFSSLGDDLATLAATDTAKLNQLAPEAIGLEKAVLVLVGDKKSIEGQIGELGLPAAVEYTTGGEAKAKRE